MMGPLREPALAVWMVGGAAAVDEGADSASDVVGVSVGGDVSSSLELSVADSVSQGVLVSVADSVSVSQDVLVADSVSVSQDVLVEVSVVSVSHGVEVEVGTEVSHPVEVGAAEESVVETLVVSSLELSVSIVRLLYTARLGLTYPRLTSATDEAAKARRIAWSLIVTFVYGFVLERR
jgi:hypothetical protein